MNRRNEIYNVLVKTEKPLEFFIDMNSENISKAELESVKLLLERVRETKNEFQEDENNYNF